MEITKRQNLDENSIANAVEFFTRQFGLGGAVSEAEMAEILSKVGLRGQPSSDSLAFTLSSDFSSLLEKEDGAGRIKTLERLFGLGVEAGAKLAKSKSGNK